MFRIAAWEFSFVMAFDFPTDLTAPFRCDGTQGRALLIHGFTGIPNEVRPIAAVFREFDFAIEAPLLPGHGADGAAINKTKAGDWHRAVEEAARRLPGNGPLVVAGVSMGGLLATCLAARKPVDALMLIAPAFELYADGKLGVKLSQMGAHQLIPVLEKKEKGGDLVDIEAQRNNPNTSEIPIRALQDLEKVRQRALKALARIKVPVFIAHGEQDRTIPARASLDASLKLRNAPEVLTHRFPASGHVLPLDLEQKELQRALRLFVQDQVLSS